MTSLHRAELSSATQDALQSWDPDSADSVSAAVAVRSALNDIAEQFPGRSVELRVVPVAAVQLVPGPAHRRGTPKATVEMSAEVFLMLLRNELSWDEARKSGEIQASGERSDLSALFPAEGSGVTT